VIWVECSGAKIFDPKSAFDELHVDGRFVSEQIREMFLWVGVFQILPTFAEFLVDEKGSVSGHLGKLFPASMESKAAPTSTAVLGGSIRADKFFVLDQLLDLVSDPPYPYRTSYYCSDLITVCLPTRIIFV
jgi:hypothetical protein